MTTPEGALDLGTAPQLKRTLIELEGEGCSHLIVDLSQVTFMDSTALGVLVGVKRRLGEEGLLAVANAGPAIVKLFQMTALDRTFELFPSTDAALSWMHDIVRQGTASDEQPATTLPLTGDAAVVLGIAATAMAFADSPPDQVERWLRALLLHGEAGNVLASLGFTDDPLDAGSVQDQPPRQDMVVAVSQRACEAALARGDSITRTTDVLVAVMDCYGQDFERVLAAHGILRDELLERVNGGALDGAGEPSSR